MNVIRAPRRDEGTGYEMRPASYKSDLVRVARGTPMGELLRRAARGAAELRRGLALSGRRTRGTIGTLTASEERHLNSSPAGSRFQHPSPTMKGTPLRLTC
jgi:hypothetical protein